MGGKKTSNDDNKPPKWVGEDGGNEKKGVEQSFRQEKETSLCPLKVPQSQYSDVSYVH